MNAYVFSQSTAIRFATNTFINVPIILQYEDIPLIEIINSGKTTKTTRIPIYNLDGTYLAKVVGSRLFTTDAGKKAGISLRYPEYMTVCELNGKTLFEIKRTSAAATSISAELYTPYGVFIKAPSDLVPQLFTSVKQEELILNGNILVDNTFMNLRIGIKILKNGSIALGVP